jgi:hypothetical protein
MRDAGTRPLSGPALFIILGPWLTPHFPFLWLYSASVAVGFYSSVRVFTGYTLVSPSDNMTTIPDAELLSHASRAKGRVVLITGKSCPIGERIRSPKETDSYLGAANGIGRETALLFAKHGCVLPCRLSIPVRLTEDLRAQS